MARYTYIPAYLQLTDAILATLDQRPSASGVTQRVEHCPEVQQADLSRVPARYELFPSLSVPGSPRLASNSPRAREGERERELERDTRGPWRMVNGKWEIVNGRPLVRAEHE